MNEAPAPPAPTHRVLLHPLHRGARRWMSGPGRHAGKILALLPLIALILLLAWVFITNITCGFMGDDTACLISFSLLGQVGLVLLLTLGLLCLSSLLARIAWRLHRVRRRRHARARLLELRAQVAPIDPLDEPNYAHLHSVWLRSEGEDAIHRRTQHFLAAFLLLLLPPLLITFLRAEEQFRGYGSLIVSELSPEATTFMLLEALLILAVTVQVKSLRVLWGVRRLVHQKTEELETQVEAAAARLPLAHLEAGKENVSPFTFRSYAAAQSAPAAKP